MVRRIRRSTVVFVEAVLAVAAAGIAAGAVLHNALGYALAGVAVLVGVAGVVRFGGRGLVDLAVDRLHDRPDPEDQLGLSRLVPQLHVAEVRTRDGGGIGVAGDGQGFVVALDAGSTAPPGWALSDLVAILVDDPARPAAVQVLVEQHALGENADPRFGPGRTYRSLAVDGIPLWNRVLLVIRHEPAWAPETVETRGGGATGARNALAAVAGRTVARARQDRIRLRPLGAAELTAVLRDLGPPPDAASDTVADGAPADDIVVSVPLARDDATRRTASGVGRARRRTQRRLGDGQRRRSQPVGRGSPHGPAARRGRRRPQPSSSRTAWSPRCRRLSRTRASSRRCRWAVARARSRAWWRGADDDDGPAAGRPLARAPRRDGGARHPARPACCWGRIRKGRRWCCPRSGRVSPGSGWSATGASPG